MIEEKIGKQILINGDCLEVMDELIKKGIKFDAIITDPPYGKVTACKWDIIIPFDEMWKRLNQLIKPNGAIVLFGSEPFSSTLRLSNLDNYKYDWIWEKTQPTGHLNAKKQPLRVFENILVFYQKQSTYNPQKTYGHIRKVSSASSRDKCIARAQNKEDRVYNKESLNKVSNYDSTERYPRNIIKFKTDKQKSKLHPTQKPVKLIEYLIKTYTKKGEKVLDFTAGSFTTMVACEKTNRYGFGIELEKKYFEIGIDRVSKQVNDKRL